MLKATEFDLKTGKMLTQYDPSSQSMQPKTREIEHSYLEHWLNHHGLSDRPLWSAKFYAGVNPADQERLEQDDKVLVLANGETGYFTDAETAGLMTQGDLELGIPPLYHFNPVSAHNLIAYGSLLVSDGIHSTVLQTRDEQRPLRLWIVDEMKREIGPASLTSGISTAMHQEEILDVLLERLGDGSLLVRPQTMRSLTTLDELKPLIAPLLEASFPNESWMEQLAECYIQSATPPSTVLPTTHWRQIVATLDDTVHQRVSQFRGATPDLPGMLKGTLSSSALVEELGVDVIASVSTVKGDDGRLSTPGIHEVSQLWLNRKRDGRYNTQAVGTQLKGTIPNATAHELNPLVLERAEAFAKMAGDVHQLAEDYVEVQAAIQTVEPQADQDWLSQIIQQDCYGVMLEGFPTVVDKLERFVRHERIDQALRGIRIPSAMAQPHGQLKPWEVCNRDLPDGAMVAYYRSPVPSVSAVALAVNNLTVLERKDREAFEKVGVSYLNPWTAQSIAITDFDGDVNGYFVGYLAAQPGLPERIRNQLQATDSLSPAQQYEAARQLFARLIAQQEQDLTQALIQPGDYPQTVSEVIDRTAPERKPPEIRKQPKLKHPWQDSETLAQATWRAWSLTAENPIGRVANAGMVLQSFAAECLYARSDEAKASLLQQISAHAQKQLRRAAAGKLDIPDNDVLTSKGFAAYDFKPRLQFLAGAAATLSTIQDPSDRQRYVAQHLQAAHDLFLDVANGPNAANLQTAVDSAKSARGIDEMMHQLALALQYKPHVLRLHRRDPTVYTAGRTLPTNTDEPIGWMVEAVNQRYEQTALQRASGVGMRFGALMDGVAFTPEQSNQAERIVTGYLSLMKQRAEAQRQQHQYPTAARQPSLTLTSAQTGRTIRVERLIDATTGHEAMTRDLWRTSGPTDWTVMIEPQRQNNRTVFAVKRALQGQPSTQPVHSPHLLGWVSEASVREQNLGQFFQRQRQLLIQSPRIEVHPPRVLQNDAEALLEKASRFLKDTKAAIPPAEHRAYAAAMWALKLPTGDRVQGRGGQRLEKRAKLGMAVALQLFPEAVGQQLRQLPPLTLSGTRYRDVTPEPGEHELLTRPYQYLDKAGYVREVVGISLIEQEGEARHLGFLGERSLQLPVGLKLGAAVHIDRQNPKHEQVTVQVQELLGRDLAISSNRERTDSRYAPTYQELRDWWRVVRRQGEHRKLDWIAELGQRLVEHYQSATKNQETPPPDYRDMGVLLSGKQEQGMHQELRGAWEQPLVVVDSRGMER